MPEDFRHLAFEFNEIVGVIQDAVCDCAVMRQERTGETSAETRQKSLLAMFIIFSFLSRDASSVECSGTFADTASLPSHQHN